MDADALGAPAPAAADGEGGAERAPLRATDPASAVSTKARSGENGQLDSASTTIATARLRLDVLTSQNRALNVSLRDLAALHTKTSAERDALRAALRDAETERDAVSRRAMALEVGVAGRETFERALAAAAAEARIANEQASEAASQVAAAVAVAAEADARADVAEAEVETLKAKLELADAERAERSAGSKNKASARETSERARPRLFVEEEEDDDDDDEREEETSFSRRLRALQLARVKDQHVAALRVGELEEELERARTAAAVFEARLRDAECEKESADERTAVAFEAVDRLRRENDALRHEKARATGGADAGRKENQPGGERGGLDDDAAGAAASRAFAAELSALRAVATGLARDICEAAEFGLAASAVDVPKAPPGAPDGEEAPAAGEAKYWYDAARNEIRLL
jgi:chromosome segregation protein